MLGLKISKRESICKNDYSLWNNTNDKLEYIYQLPNIPTSLQTKTEFMTNNIAINITENKHKLKQSKFVSKTEKDPSVRQLAENNTNNNMIEKTKIKYISNHKDREDIQIKKAEIVATLINKEYFHNLTIITTQLIRIHSLFLYLRVIILQNQSQKSDS